jgi:two-component system LytT family sensor kinase
MKRVYDFLFKYRIFHVIYWMWDFITLLHLRIENSGGTLSDHLPTSLMIFLPQVACAYSVVYFLVPPLIQRQKYFRFVVLTLAFMVAAGYLSALMIDWYSWMVKGKQLNGVHIMAIALLSDMFLVVAIFIAVVVIARYYKNAQYSKQLEKERLETELNFLKAQINPHFLFNALNSIYVLIDINKKTASDALLKFSGLLRYQLYECRENKVDVARELLFLHDYIGLEKIRNNDNLEVVVDVADKIQHFQIAPFLLIPFVENAFKHISIHDNELNFIRISARFERDHFSFSVSNSFDEQTENNDNKGGIGLQNVQRRLELIYPGAHKLEIKKTDGVYSVHLTLYTGEHELHHS